MVNPNPRYWTDASLTIGATASRSIARGASYSFIIRIILDWHLTGRNRLKCEQQPDIHDEVAACLLCNAPFEDQQHILCHCTHPQIVQTRQHHLSTIQSKLALLPPKAYATKIIKAYHQAAVTPMHFELLLGRVHTHSMNIITQLPTAKSDAQAKAALSQLTTHVRDYLSMAIAIYQTRQTLLTMRAKEPDIDLTILNYDPVHLRHQANEILCGMDPHHVVRVDGSKITRNIADTIPTTISKHRTLTYLNSRTIRKDTDYRNRRQEIVDARIRKQATAAAEAKITKVDHTEWNNRYCITRFFQPTGSSCATQPIADNTPDNNPRHTTQIASTDSKREAQLHAAQNTRLQQLLSLHSSIGPPCDPWQHTSATVPLVTPSTPDPMLIALPNETSTSTPLHSDIRLITEIFSPVVTNKYAFRTPVIQHQQQPATVVSSTRRTSTIKHCFTPISHSGPKNKDTVPATKKKVSFVTKTKDQQVCTSSAHTSIGASTVTPTLTVRNGLHCEHHSPMSTDRLPRWEQEIPVTLPPSIQVYPCPHDTIRTHVRTSPQREQPPQADWDRVASSPLPQRTDIRPTIRSSPGMPGARSGQG